MSALKVDLNSFLPLLEVVSGGSPTSPTSSAKPTVAITSVGGSVTNASQTIAGKVDVADAGSTVKVLDGTTQIGSATVGANGAWSAKVTLPHQGANVITATDTNVHGWGTSSAVAYDYEPPALPTAQVAPTLTVANQSLRVSPGGHVSLGLGVSVPNVTDNMTVNISGLPNYETITDNLDHKTFSGSSVTLTPAEVNSGLSLNSSYRGQGQPTATLTVTATDHTDTPAMTSAAKTIMVTDPPAMTTLRGGSWGLSQHGTDVTQWFDSHPDFARAAATLSEAGASRSGSPPHDD